MVSELPLRSRWAALALVLVVAAPGGARAQEPMPRGFALLDLLARGPELGALDVPSDLPRALPASVPPLRSGPETALTAKEAAPAPAASAPGGAPGSEVSAPGLASGSTPSAPGLAPGSTPSAPGVPADSAPVVLASGARAGPGASTVSAVYSEPAEPAEPAAPSSAASGLAATEAGTPSVSAPGMPVPRPGGPPGLSPLSPLQPRSFQVLPVAASVLPGLLFHGLGPWLAGDGHTSKQLFALEGTGLGLIALGGVPIVFTGASRRTIGPLYAVTLAGFSVFGVSTLANLYAVTSPAFDPGRPPASLPPLELEMGYQYVSDPSFDYGGFVALGALARFDPVKLEASARVSPDEGNTQVRAGGAYRLLGGPERARGGADGTSLDAELFGLYHRYPTEGFTLAGAEVGLRGRYAMARVSPALAGSFAEASLGTSFQGYSYPGAVSEGDLHEQLLFTFGYGVWLGRGGPLRGEAMLYYDHRKDGYVGGMRTMGGGVVGSFGLRGRALLTEDWGVTAELQAGGALVGRLALVYAFGGEP